MNTTRNTHRHGHTHAQTHTQTYRHNDTQTQRHIDTQTQPSKRREKNWVKSVRIYRKHIRVSFGAVCHAVARSSVKFYLRSVCIMHLVCCMGESVCATSHLLYVLPCRVAAWHATPAVRPPKGNPKCIWLAKRCKEMYGGPRKTKSTVVF